MDFTPAQEKLLMIVSFYFCVAVLAYIFAKDYFSRFWRITGIFGRLGGVAIIIMSVPLPFIMVKAFQGYGDFDWVEYGWIAPWLLLYLVFSAIENIQKKVIYLNRLGISTYFFWGRLPYNAMLGRKELRQSEYPVAFFATIAFKLLMAMVIFFYIGLSMHVKFGIDL